MTTPIDWIPLIAVYLVLTTIVVGLRLWIRVGLTKSWGQDDAMLLMAQSGMVAHFAVYFAVCAYYPQHTLDIDAELFHKINVLWFWATFCYAGSQVALKMSMGLFFLALARLRWQKLVILIPTAIFVVYNTVLAFLLVFRCGARPVSPFLIMSKRDCIIDGPLFSRLLAVNSAFNAVLDWIFAVIPIFMVIRARRLDARSRKAVWFLVMLAMAGSVVSLVRIPYTKDYQFGPQLWHSTLRISLVSSTETAIGTIAISMATMKPLLRPFRRLCRKFCFLSTNDSYEMRKAPSNPDVEAGLTNAAGEPGTINLDTQVMRGIGLLPDATYMSGDDDSERKWSGSNYTIKTNTSAMTMDTETGMARREGLLSISEVSPREEEEIALAVREQRHSRA
ncbi:Hypothetical protein D9617_24g017650 [Elsinoe fawcettii]|nr:Hypothetical protein D9617_24g017650 [Elsinoe fawcettii]